MKHLAALGLLACLLGCQAEDPLTALKDAPRTKAANFEVTGMDGKKVKLSDYRGKVVLVDFWATWCGYCVGGMPGLDELYRTHKDKGFEVMMVSNEDPTLVKDFVAKQPYDIQFYLDHNGEGHTFYDVVSYPSAVIVDREGMVVAKLRGSHANSVLLEVLRAAGLDDSKGATVASK